MVEDLGRTYHEVALGEGHEMGEVCLFCVGRGALDLIPVVVQAGDFAAGEERDFASGTADAAAHVENLHALL